MKDFIEGRDKRAVLDVSRKKRIGWDEGLTDYSEYFFAGRSFSGDKEALIKAIDLARNYILSMELPHPVQLRFEKADMSATDGHDILVSTKQFDDSRLSSLQKIDLFIGDAIHEVAHVKFTSFEEIKMSSKTSLIKVLTNIIEDERIEMLVCSDNPGYANFLSAMKKHNATRMSPIIDKAIESEDTLNDFFQAVFHYIRYPFMLKEDAVELFKDDLNIVKDILTPYPSDTRQARLCAVRISDYMKKRFKEILREKKILEIKMSKKAKDEEESSDEIDLDEFDEVRITSDDEDDSEESKESKDKKGKKGKKKTKDSEGDEEELDEDGELTTDDFDEDTDEPKEKKSKGKKESDEEDSSDKDDEGGSGEPFSEDSPDEHSSGFPSLDDMDTEFPSDSMTDLEDSPSMEGDGEAGDETSSGKSGAEESDVTDSMDEKEDASDYESPFSDGTDKMSEEEKTDMEKKIEEELHTVLSELDAAESRMHTEEEDKTSTLLDGDEFKEAMTAYFEDASAVMDGNIFFIKSPPGNSGAYMSAVSKCTGLSSTINRLLRFQHRDEDISLKGMTSGHLDINRLAEAAQGYSNVYEHFQEVRSEKGAVILVDDESGSMASSSKYIIARESCIAIEQSLKGNQDVELYCYGFSGDQTFVGSTEVYIYKEKGFYPKYGFTNAGARCQNRDGDAIYGIARRFRKMSKRPAIMFVISDGEPAANDYMGSYAISDTRKKILMAQKLGIHVVGILIYEATKADKMYDDFFIIHNVSQLPTELAKISKSLITRLFKVQYNEL